MSRLKNCLRTILKPWKIEVLSQWELPIGGLYQERRMHWMRELGVTKLLDVGANEGQYALSLLRKGVDFHIMSIEPLRSAYSKIETASKEWPNWKTFHFAVGDYDGTCEINIAGNSQSSSILAMETLHEYAIPQSRYVGKEEVGLVRLDTFLAKTVDGQDKVWLKVDVQGFEDKVWKALGATFPRR